MDEMLICRTQLHAIGYKRYTKQSTYQPHTKEKKKRKLGFQIYSGYLHLKESLASFSSIRPFCTEIHQN